MNRSHTRCRGVELSLGIALMLGTSPALAQPDAAPEHWIEARILSMPSVPPCGRALRAGLFTVEVVDARGATNLPSTLEVVIFCPATPHARYLSRRRVPRGYRGYWFGEVLELGISTTLPPSLAGFSVVGPQPSRSPPYYALEVRRGRHNLMSAAFRRSLQRDLARSRRRD